MQIQLQAGREPSSHEAGPLPPHDFRNVKDTVGDFAERRPAKE